MDTAPLKSFATWARTALIREVSARISVVLASQELHQEQPKAVAALEKAINAAGGGNKGRGVVADKVAYIWFNRIIALRFMDANGYTGIGVVSPERGREGGQPEVLAEAKRGNIDSAVVTNKRTAETVTSLLNGTRRSEDPQGETYALLLAEYCRHWNRSMPFMFEREGDYTELLIPANLLANDSVLARAVSVLTEEVCQDVEVIGWLYQFYISERKDEVFASFKKNKKAGAAEIPAATQLFTPHWIVRYLVENSLGRLWLLNRPTSRLADQMDYYITPVDEESDYLKVSSPEELKIIDPACGSGHMLTYAFDLVYTIYEEEGYAPSDIPRLILANNLYGTEIDPRAGALAAFALAMKARSRQRTFFSKQVQPNICVLEPISFTLPELDTLGTRDGDRHDDEFFWNQFQHADTFGSLIRPREQLIEKLRRHLDDISPSVGNLLDNDLLSRAHQVIAQAEYLTSRYQVLITNPPYMGAKNMDARLAAFAKDEYSDSKADLMTMFMARAQEVVINGGYWAMINLPSWMSLSTFTQFRIRLLKEVWIQSLIGMGRGVFGSDFGSVAFVCVNRRELSDRTGVYRRLFTNHVDVRRNEVIRELFLDSGYNRFLVPQSRFRAFPGAVIAYSSPEWLQDLMLAKRTIGDFGDAKQGLITGDVGRFVRKWYEISQRDFCVSAPTRLEALKSGKRWFPLNSGGEFRRWYGNQELVVDWHNDGHEIRNFSDDQARLRSRPQNLEYMFRAAVGWSAVTSGPAAFRWYPEGFLFDNAGMSLFLESREDQLRALGFLNSSVARELLKLLSPTMNLNAGQISSLPVDELLKSVDVDSVRRLVEIARTDWASYETSWEFSSFLPATQDNAHGESLEQRVASELENWTNRARDAFELEQRVDGEISASVGSTLEPNAVLSDVSLCTNIAFTYGNVDAESAHARAVADVVAALISYSVGCMFGRYSLDEPGLILANQGDTLQNYLARVPSPSFVPDKDNVIPIVDGDWFEDDIAARFRQFLRVAFGEQHFEENLRFVTEALGVKGLRDYFLKSFYKDHVQRYKKRPIYWLFSSPKGSFNALIYMHRYTPSTVSTVLNEYLREFKAKLAASREHHERLAAGTGTPRQQAAAQKEADRLRKVLLELDEYEHDVLYPLATQQVQIDFDDGVKANYPKLGAALKKIPGLEASYE